jgi:menaquinone-dependent protoporphyrinogen oxidase
MILVAYATKHGSTREVARAVAATLREEGHAVELREAADVHDVSAYEGVVLGGSIHMGRLHQDARRFLHRHGAALGRTPLAVFALGPRTLSEHDVAESRSQLDRSLGGVDPARVAIFGGVVDPATLSFPFNRLPASDARDWDAISAWAGDVGDLIEREAPHTMRPCTAPS